MVSNLRESLEKSHFYDLRFEFSNLDKEELLNKVASQVLYIEKLEKAHIEHITEIEELKEKNLNLEYSLFALNR